MFDVRIKIKSYKNVFFFSVVVDEFESATLECTAKGSPTPRFMITVPYFVQSDND